ncbi:hypothetical protein [Nissabacter sp. SGAir0207]|uniref:hypothetical protein n=1 Tax=Nissabacter sp. SGAir0207 TaxID=2126321 RepID=UPI0010F43745|nr:hypothetical protein [Nissabacter sp. SGAir0207]
MLDEVKDAPLAGKARLVTGEMFRRLREHLFHNKRIMEFGFLEAAQKISSAMLKQHWALRGTFQPFQRPAVCLAKVRKAHDG